MTPRRTFIVWSFAVLVLAGSAVARQEVRERTVEVDDLSWPVRLGARALMVERAVPVVDQVVLVPDGATYLDELGRWSPAGRWPVLLEDDHLAPMFIRRFEPARVLRRASVGDDRAVGGEERLGAMLEVVTRAWGGAAGTGPAAAFTAHAWVPPGVVLADPDDGAWTAAVALAAGWGQPIVALEERFGGPNGRLDADSTRRLVGAVERAVASTGLQWDALGDDVDAITICRSVAGRVTLPGAGGPRGPGDGADDPRAMTDVVGRSADGTRWAVAGWIFGSETRSAYVAMCSLFLPRSSARLVDTYPAGPGWDDYAMAPAAATLEARGARVERQEADAASLAGWRRSIERGWAEDLVLVNTRGNAAWFMTSDEQRGLADDVPVLNVPAAVHFVHSWSMAAPNASSTLAGQWIDHGAYAYVGSCHEPYLQAFVPPSALAERIAGHVPLLAAARHLDRGSLGGRPWKVNVYGDPLMPGLREEGRSRRPARESGADEIDLEAFARARLVELGERLAGDGAEDEQILETIACARSAAEALRLLGRDGLLVDLWTEAGRSGDADVAAAIAPSVLGPLFRAGRWSGVARAFELGGLGDPLARDMVWHGLERKAAGSDGAEIVAALAGAIRADHPDQDLERLRGPMLRHLGRPSFERLVTRIIARTEQAAMRRRLEKLLRPRARRGGRSISF